MPVACSESSNLIAFGPEAERIARRCPSDLGLFFYDGTNLAEALATAVARRREGHQYLVAPLLRDPQSVVARLAASAIYEQTANADQRRALFESLAADTLTFNDRPVSKHNIYAPEVVHTMREISQLGDGLYVRSHTERARVEQMFFRKRLYVAVAPLVDPSVPMTKPALDASDVIVWAPNEDAQSLAIFSYALWHLKKPAVFVCRGEIPNSPHRFVAPEFAEVALAQAAVIIDTAISDPGTAIALAGRGYGLVTAATTGAHEYIQGVATYNSHDFSSIYGAMTRARADRRAFLLPTIDSLAAIRAAISAAQPALLNDAPLVSMVIPTYNRREHLRRSLDLFNKQRYPNFEVIVVNDCGEDVSDLVALYPFARYLCTPENCGTSAAYNFGLRQARGEYIGVVADDDCNYAAQIASLASALVASGVDVAHGNILLRLDTTLSDGQSATYGHLLEHDGDHDAWHVHWGMPICAQGYLIRRESFESVGFIDENLVCTSDLDLSIKLSKKYDFVHVSTVTGEMSFRDDKSNLSSKIGDGLAGEIYATQKSHAPPDSEVIAQRIEQNANFMRYLQTQPTFFSPWLRLETPIPLEH